MTTDQDTRTALASTTSLRGQALVEKVKELVREGNVRRIVVKNDAGHTVMELPLTAGVVAAVIAPALSAIGAIAALAAEWTIEVERTAVATDDTIKDD